MYYIYILKSIKLGVFYIGYTSDLKKRINEHHLGKSTTTKKYLPIKLVYYEAYLSKKDAICRENKLKQYGSSLAKLKKRIGNSINLEQEGLG